MGVMSEPRGYKKETSAKTTMSSQAVNMTEENDRMIIDGEMYELIPTPLSNDRCVICLEKYRE